MATHNLHHKIQRRRLVHQRSTVVCPVGKEMLQAWPALLQCLKNRDGSRAISNVCRRQVHHQQPPICIHGNMPLAPDDLLRSIVAALFRRWRLHRLTIYDTSAGARLPSLQLPVEHQYNIVERAKQEPAHQSAKPPIHRLPGREVLG
ncbi:hypothetical protein D9M69_509930 [compost metagenome]